MAVVLEVGTNTYITLAEANSYLEIYTSEYIVWSALTEAEKNNLLVRAKNAIDRLNYQQPKTTSQALKFPLWYQADVPNNVKEAQAIEALTLSNLDFKTEDGYENNDLMYEEVREGKVGYRNFGLKGKGITSDIAYQLIQRYIVKTGSY